MADKVITEELLNYFWTKGIQPLFSKADSIEKRAAPSATLLSEEITDIPKSSFGQYVLKDKWENYKILSIVIEMSFTSTDIRTFTYNYFTSVLSSIPFHNALHEIYRQVGTGTQAYAAELQMKLYPDANMGANAETAGKEIFFKKVATTYDGARKVWVYGIN